MWSNDHMPPHVHVRPAQANPEWEIIVFLGNQVDGSMDAYGQEFGDTKIVSGKIRTSQINAFVAYLNQRRDETWTKWQEING
jgi:Domain of unknown function (DUF4160)